MVLVSQCMLQGVYDALAAVAKTEAELMWCEQGGPVVASARTRRTAMLPAMR